MIVLVPKRWRTLPIKHLRKTEEAYNEFGRYLQELLEDERIQFTEGTKRSNLLSGLIYHGLPGNEFEEQRSLRDDEIIGNAFVLLIAGYETTYTHVVDHTDTV